MTTDILDMKQKYCLALMELCETQNINHMSASAVIKHAGTARQTFYNHFRDINDLIAYIPIGFLKQGGCR